MLKKLLVLFSLLYLASCASLSEEECHTGNWKDIGYNDGLTGQPMKQFSKHLKACSEYGIKPNITTYKAGRNKGLNEYCDADKAYDYGYEGQPYFNVCRGTKNGKKFEKEYKLGKSTFDIKTQLESVRKKIDKNKNDMNFFKDNETMLSSLRNDNRRLKKKLKRLKAKLLAIQIQSKRNLENLIELF